MMTGLVPALASIASGVKVFQSFLVGRKHRQTERWDRQTDSWHVCVTFPCLYTCIWASVYIQVHHAHVISCIQTIACGLLL